MFKMNYKTYDRSLTRYPKLSDFYYCTSIIVGFSEIPKIYLEQIPQTCIQENGLQIQLMKCQILIHHSKWSITSKTYLI